jgi:caa(3)-type oxidase subunit IV
MPRRIVFLGIWLLLLVVLGVSMTATALHLGAWTPALNLGVAAASALLIAWFDMHLESAAGLLRLFAGGLIIFLMIMFGLGLADWLTR